MSGSSSTTSTRRAVTRGLPARPAEPQGEGRALPGHRGDLLHASNLARREDRWPADATGEPVGDGAKLAHRRHYRRWRSGPAASVSSVSAGAAPWWRATA